MTEVTLYEDASLEGKRAFLCLGGARLAHYPEFRDFFRPTLIWTERA